FIRRRFVALTATVTQSAIGIASPTIHFVVGGQAAAMQCPDFNSAKLDRSGNLRRSVRVCIYGHAQLAKLVVSPAIDITGNGKRATTPIVDTYADEFFG